MPNDLTHFLLAALCLFAGIAVLLLVPGTRPEPHRQRRAPSAARRLPSTAQPDRRVQPGRH